MSINTAINEYLAIDLSAADALDRINEIVEAHDVSAHELLGLLAEARREAQDWRKEALSHRGTYVERAGIIEKPLPWKLMNTTQPKPRPSMSE